MAGPKTRGSRRQRAARHRAATRRRRRLRAGLGTGAFLAVAAVALVLAAGGGGGDDGPPSASDASPASSSELAPDTPFTMWDGSTATLADWAGQPLVVNFFASWCVPCLAEMPGFERVHQQLGDRVAFLGINLQDTRSAAAEVIEQTGITYDVALDPRGDLFTALGGFAMPTTAFVGPDGAIADRRHGEISAEALRDRIEVLFLGAEASELPAGTETFDDLSNDHIQGPVAYEQTPPAGGPHWEVWQNCGAYTEPVPDERAVHSLEHGAVWITYRPDLPDQQVGALAALARRTEKLLVSPYPELRAPVVATAWGRQIELESATDPRLAAFIDAIRHASEAPEPGGPCTGGLGRPGLGTPS